MALTKEKLQQLFAAGEFDLPGGDWDSITGKPTSFPTTWALVSGKPTVFATNWASITEKPSTFPPSTHSHSYLPLTGGTMTGSVSWYEGTGHETILPGHFYTNYHSTSTGAVYFHTGLSGLAIGAKFNLRVWKDASTFRTLLLDGAAGTMDWDGRRVLDSGNYGTYVTPASIGAAASSHSHSTYFPFQTGGALDVNSTSNGTKLFVGTSESWTNKGPTGHNGSALLSMNTHPGLFYSQLWFDTEGNRFFHRTINIGSIRAWHEVITSNNYTSYAQKKITYGTAAPTGGVDGDYYVQY